MLGSWLSAPNRSHSTSVSSAGQTWKRKKKKKKESTEKAGDERRFWAAAQYLSGRVSACMLDLIV